jgi:hypothetical protein
MNTTNTRRHDSKTVKPQPAHSDSVSVRGGVPEGPKRFVPYDRVPLSRIREAAQRIASLGPKNCRTIVMGGFRAYYGDTALASRLPRAEVSDSPLRGVPRACLVVNFERSPLLPTESILAHASLFSWKANQDVLVPAVFLYGPAGHASLAHEKVHLCQYLSGQPYPLTEAEIRFVLRRNLKDALPEIEKSMERDKAVEFIANLVCYKLWIEAEAVHACEPKLSAGAWMKRAYRSANCFETLEESSKRLKWAPEEDKKAVEMFYGFCDVMQAEVGWVRDLLSDGRQLRDVVAKVYQAECERRVFGFSLEDDDDEEEEERVYDDNDADLW